MSTDPQNILHGPYIYSIKIYVCSHVTFVRALPSLIKLHVKRSVQVK